MKGKNKQTNRKTNKQIEKQTKKRTVKVFIIGEGPTSSAINVRSKNDVFKT